MTAAGTVALHGAAQRQGKQQSGDRVDRHEPAGQHPVITVPLEQHRQGRRQLELLEGGEDTQ